MAMAATTPCTRWRRVRAPGDVNADLLYGGTGADVLYTDGTDYLYGEATDTLHGEFGANNRLAGGTEKTIFYVSANGSTITGTGSSRLGYGVQQ